MYVSNIDLTNPVVETVLDIGCRNAIGLTAADDVFRDVWLDFEGPLPGVKRADGFEMKYWGAVSSNPATANSVTHPEYFSYAGLIKNADGRCNAWAELFVAVLAVQGVTSEFTGIVPNDASAPAGANASDIRVFADHSAQGMPEVENEFADHAVVRVTIDGKVWVLDPSYGTGYFPTLDDSGFHLLSAEMQYEEASISHLRYTDGQWRENPSDVRNIFFFAVPFAFTP